MAIKRDYNPGHDWYARVITIWAEDDAPVPDKESTEAAFNRITGTTYHRIKEEIDHGDTTTYLYEQGWVKTVSFDGGQIGFVYKNDHENNTEHYYARQYNMAKAMLLKLRAILNEDV